MCQPRRAPPWRGWWGAARQRAAPNAFWVSRGRCSRTASVLSLSAPHARARRLSRTNGWHGRAAWPSARLLRRRKVFLSAPTPKTQAGGLRASQAPHGAQPQPRRARARVGWRAGVGGAGALGPPRSALRVALSMVIFTRRGTTVLLSPLFTLRLDSTKALLRAPLAQRPLALGGTGVLCLYIHSGAARLPGSGMHNAPLYQCAPRCCCLYSRSR